MRERVVERRLELTTGARLKVVLFLPLYSGIHRPLVSQVCVSIHLYPVLAEVGTDPVLARAGKTSRLRETVRLQGWWTLGVVA